MRRKLVLDVPDGTVCRHKGWWGVLNHRAGIPSSSFDPWDAPRIPLGRLEEVEVPENGKRRLGGDRWK